MQAPVGQNLNSPFVAALVRPDEMISNGWDATDINNVASANILPIGSFRYLLKDTRSSSEKLGNCEVCDKFVTTVFYQLEERSYVNKIKKSIRWSAHQTRNLFGHSDCLKSIRKN